jgi:hypothetical protein
VFGWAWFSRLYRPFFSNLLRGINGEVGGGGLQIRKLTYGVVRKLRVDLFKIFFSRGDDGPHSLAATLYRCKTHLERGAAQPAVWLFILARYYSSDFR